ncbi:MAG TPA: DUF5684 domain-containing protein [Niabella sp.]|nr:DUF5684 domain-containing protein [Niabella sp.]
MYETTPSFPTGSILFLIAVCVFYIYCMWKIYRKAGYQGWEAIIPIYSTYILLKIVGKPWWWLLLMLIPGVNIIYAIWTYNMLSKSFGKTELFTVGLLLLSFIFIPVLAFGDAKYLGPYGDRAAFLSYGDKNRFDFENPQQL